MRLLSSREPQKPERSQRWGLPRGGAAGGKRLKQTNKQTKSLDYLKSLKELRGDGNLQCLEMKECD